MYHQVRAFLFDPASRDQVAEKKLRFVKAVVGKQTPSTRVSALGVSNARIVTFAKDLYRENKNTAAPLDTYMAAVECCDRLWREGTMIEEYVMACKILSMFQKNFTREDVWERADKHWVDLVDQWIMADHLCMDVLSHFPADSGRFYSDLLRWAESDNPWRRRVALVCFIKQVRKRTDAIDAMFDMMVEKNLLTDRNEVRIQH